MKGHARKIGAPLALLLFLSASPNALAAKKVKIPVGDLVGIEVNFLGGKLEVMAWNGKHVTVESRGKPLPTEREGQVLLIGNREIKDTDPESEVKIYAPEHLTLKVTTKRGAVEIQGLKSRLQVYTMSGSVRIASCSNPVEVETVSGDIGLNEIKGDVALKTVSGTIRGRHLESTFMGIRSVSGDQYLQNISTRQLRLRTHSGAIELTGEVPPDGFWESSTFEGRIEFSLTNTSRLDLEAHSRFGKLKIDEAIVPGERDEHYFRSRARPGVTLVRLTSFNGEIEVRVED